MLQNIADAHVCYRFSDRVSAGSEFWIHPLSGGRTVILVAGSLRDCIQFKEKENVEKQRVTL